MRSISRLRLALVGLSILLVATISCGADGDDPDHADNPIPGFTDPCQTPMGGAFGCPAGSSTPSTPATTRPEDACARLVSCGILADVHETRSNNHWVHFLDYRWCLDRLREPPDRRCSAGGNYSVGESSAAVSCILATPCSALGAPLSEKEKSSSHRSVRDLFFCADGTTKIWTATVCDHGILYYW